MLQKEFSAISYLCNIIDCMLCLSEKMVDAFEDKINFPQELKVTLHKIKWQVDKLHSIAFIFHIQVNPVQ